MVDKKSIIMRRIVMKRQLKLNLYELIKKNKEELLKDRNLVEKIEKRVEEKIMKQNINLSH